MLDYAIEMTRTPLEVPDPLFEKLREQLSEPELVELSGAIAWENFRARFNHALHIEAAGFSDGAFCPLPQRAPR